MTTELECRECGKRVPGGARYVCEDCFGPLGVVYDYEAIAKRLTREAIERRPPTMWRYRELLPLDEPPTVGTAVGMTPLVRARRLEKLLGVRELWIKNDAVSFPTLSFKDRVVAVALSKARELGFETVGCASTGNLANSVAAHAAAAGFSAWILIPEDLEPGKVVGTSVYGPHLVAVRGAYDDVNRLCAEIAGRHPIGLVNVNLRAYYAEGSKSFGFEIAEQLGWRLPDHVVAPMASGSLVTKIEKSFGELAKLGLVEERPVVFHGGQGEGCAPIVDAIRAGRDLVRPVRQPHTIAKSLAIGNPADGYYAARCVLGSGGSAAAPDDEAIRAAILLLAETEGIFTETAGGVTFGAYRMLLDEGRIPREACVVVSITGNGLKTLDAVAAAPPPVIAPRIDEFDRLLGSSRASIETTRTETT
ncbi:MAG: threonine synthase [Deltaproteobacteria bacterium]|nr:threonine synthase [Deltaproteobacteria bacterium]